MGQRTKLQAWNRWVFVVEQADAEREMRDLRGYVWWAHCQLVVAITAWREYANAMCKLQARQKEQDALDAERAAIARRLDEEQARREAQKAAAERAQQEAEAAAEAKRMADAASQAAADRRAAEEERRRAQALADERADQLAAIAADKQAAEQARQEAAELARQRGEAEAAHRFAERSAVKSASRLSPIKTTTRSSLGLHAKLKASRMAQEQEKQRVMGLLQQQR